MKLTGLTLYHFRNYEELHLALHPGVNLLVGENAQGKTNLLEAVFYLSTGGSFRTGAGAGADRLRRGVCRPLVRAVFRRARAEHPRGALCEPAAAAALHRRREAAVGSGAARRADDGAVLPGRPSDSEGRSGGQAEAARYGTLPAAARLRRGACRVSEALRQQKPHFEGLSRAAVAA